MSKQYQTFAEFYPYYLSEHADSTCRRLHFLGTVLVISIFAYAIVSLNFWWLLAMPVIGYGFAWVGHFVFEKNVPATFEYPGFSLMGDFVMFKDMIVGRVGW
jgi:hypothetical protein